MSDEKEIYIGYVEMALAIGDMIGPALSGFYYGYFGFSGTFYIFGGMIFLGTLLSIFWIPSLLNNQSKTTEKNDNKQDNEMNENGSFRG